MPEFASRNPSHPEFWDERFEQGFTPWNRGAVPQNLQDYVRQIGQTQSSLPVCLIPGCGHAHELGFFSEAGWQVTAIDFSPAAVATAKAQLSPWADRIVLADFFSYTPSQPPSVIYERAFFCALPPTQRSAVITRWVQLLASGGQLIGYFLLDDADNASKKGPPFRTHPSEFFALMQNDFVLVEDKEVSDSLAVFEGKERWQVWQRK